MAKTIEQLSRRIEEVVHEHLLACRREAEAAVERAFNVATRNSPREVSASKRRAQRGPGELSTLRERLLRAVQAKPGETMPLLARELGVTGDELQFPMRQLKESKQVRSAGERNSTRYFPMVVSKSA